MEALITILTSSFGGSLLGGLFGWLNRREQNKTRKDDQDHEFRMVGARSTAEERTTDARAFEESQKTKSPIADIIKSAVRPLITGVLMYQLYIILISLEDITGGLTALPPEMVLELYEKIILNIISLTSTAVSWWFASRANYHPEIKKHEA